MSRRSMAAKTGQAFGGRHDDIGNEITRRFFRSVEVMHPIEIDPEDMLTAMFPAQCIAAMRVAYPWCETQGSYSHMDYKLWPGVSIRFPNWEWLRMQAPKVAHLHINDDTPVMRMLLAWCREVEKVRHEWSLVEKVVDYMHENAKPSAVRYYFPAVLALVPGDKSPYDKAIGWEPRGIGPLLPLIRKASEIIAASQFLPPGRPQDKAHMHIHFDDARTTFAGVSVPTYTTDGAWQAATFDQIKVRSRIVGILHPQ